MKAFVFVFVLILPSGEPKMEARLVEKCPDNEKIEYLFNDMKKEGEIADWGAVCVKFETQGSI